MTGNVYVSAKGLPRSELNRLLGAVSAETGVAVHTEVELTRSVDPQMGVALIQGTAAVLVPFITVLASRLFSRDNTAKLEVKPPQTASSLNDGADPARPLPAGASTILLATQSPEERHRLLAMCIQGGIGSVEISVAD